MYVAVDLGYQGIVTDYPLAHIAIPHKKPRKSKAHLHTCLTDLQKQSNRSLHATRVIVEHAISGLKRFFSTVHAFRNRIPNFINTVMLLAASLWNFKKAVLFHLII